MALSRMMQHYLQLKEKYKDAIVFYRLGDFYEMFFEDAEKASNILGLTLTGRDCGLESRAPMCGIPFHSAETYVAKLLEAGIKVAICEQLSEPKPGQIVDRDIVRVITPGTIMEENILIGNKNNFIASVSSTNLDKIGVSWLDLTTGEFYLSEFVGEKAFSKLNDLLANIKPSEIISNKLPFLESYNLSCVKMEIVPKFYNYLDNCFELSNATKSLLNQLKIPSLTILNCNDKTEGVCAAGALIEYILQTQKRDLSHINKLVVQKDGKFMQLDVTARLNLELTETIFERKRKGSLIWVLDKTQTAMGSRTLNSWLDNPLQDGDEINKRLNAVEELISNNIVRDKIEQSLHNFGDLERVCAKISFGNLGPKNCISIKDSLSKLPVIVSYLKQLNSDIFKQFIFEIGDFTELKSTLENAFIDEPPALVKDGGFIKQGFNEEFDKYKKAMLEGKNWILELEKKEKELTGIKNLKIRYNRIVGYYFEVTKSNLESVPFRFERKQSLANSERFTTPELRNMEATILGAEEKALNLEIEIFNDIRKKLNERIVDFQKTAKQIACLDVLLTLAKVAIENNYVKPIINENIKEIRIENGRHPVVEKLNRDERFVPNDVLLNDENRTLIITGPNMSGKSTYMRQIAIITLLAHIGSFVPATKAEIAITDRIFTRVGASDNLGMGQSTFMVEMVEVANIVQNATAKSLLILDEIGRGTSTYDGLSIAWAVVEYIAKVIKAKTLFATHYHELTELEGMIQGVKNYQVAVKEYDNNIIFLHNIIKGSANKSFGIEVAHLAGINQEIVKRAREVLHMHEQMEFNSSPLAKPTNNQVPENNDKINKEMENIIKTLSNIEPNVLTPLEALSILADLKQKLTK